MPRNTTSKNRGEHEGLIQEAFHECEPDETNKHERIATPKRGTTSNGAGRRRSQDKDKSPSLLRSLSSSVVDEVNRRRRASVKENLPETPQGWAVFLSLMASLLVGYEVRLQKSLTAPPRVFGQLETSPVLRELYDRLTHNKDAILARNILPSLFVGTRASLASAAGYALGGPSPDAKFLCFQELLPMTQDGAKVAIDWELPPDTRVNREERIRRIKSGPIQLPVVLIVHGLNNDASFGYVKSLMRACAERGWIAIGMHFRGMGGVPLHTPRGYNGAYTGDIRCVVRTIAARMEKGNSMFLVGNSLGANLMTKFLGEEGRAKTIPECVAGGISIGNPIRIHSANLAFPWGHVIGLGTKKDILLRMRAFRPMMTSKGFRDAFTKFFWALSIGEIDEAVAPVLIANNSEAPFETRVGYENAEAYWHDASSYRHIRHVSVPLLVLTSEDDFIVHHGAQAKLSYCLANPNVMVVNTRCGGHLGWHESPPDSKSLFGIGTSWADTATTDFIGAVLERNRKISGQKTSQNEGLRLEKQRLRSQALDDAKQLRSRL